MKANNELQTVVELRNVDTHNGKKSFRKAFFYCAYIYKNTFIFCINRNIVPAKIRAMTTNSNALSSC
jgi:hypothetical protein